MAAQQAFEAIPVRLETPPTGVVPPPASTRKQNLPFGELAWEDFEKLCLSLARLEGDVEHCQLFGLPGEQQEGIDFFVRVRADATYRVYQCKRESKFGPAKITKAVGRFLSGAWAGKANTLILCTKESLRSTQRSNSFELQAQSLLQRGITLKPWDSEQLSTHLKEHPQLVDEFFGREWVRLFCGDDHAAGCAHRLDAKGVSEFRTRLGQFYHRVFNTQDPGLPHGELTDRAFLPLEKRFVVPDLLDQRTINLGNEAEQAWASRWQREKEIDHGSERRERPDFDLRSVKTSQPRVVMGRGRVDQWLESSWTSIVVGDPGSGKSTLLRFIALDVLRDSPQLEGLARRWGRHLPIWVPFALWTRLIATRPDLCSLTDVLSAWLKGFNEERLWPLLERALADDRVLLLVDGLDEWESEDSADIALNALQVFAEQRGVPLIVTTRPRGVDRLRLPVGKWRLAVLAPFSDDQQRTLARTWFEHWHRRAADTGRGGEFDSGNQIHLYTESFVQELRRSPDITELARIPLLLLLLIYHRLQRSALPTGRFNAYESMVEHLVTTHPKRRRAAGLASSDGDLAANELTRAFAVLAFHVQCHHVGGIIDQKESIRFLTDWLKDKQFGLGLDQAESIRLSRQLLDVGEGSVGLLVKRSMHEIGFFHRTFQEFLAGIHLSECPFDDQKAVVTERCGDPRWHETILCLLHLTRRREDVATFLELIEARLESADILLRQSLERLVAEIGFGHVGADPKRATSIAQATFRRIERGEWWPQRESLLRIVLDGQHTATVKSLVKEKIAEWFPCRMRWRQELYFAMAEWEFSDDVIDCLWRGLHDEEILNQRSAGLAIAKLANGHQMVGDEIASLAAGYSRPVVRAIALEALIAGWPEHKCLPDAIASAHASRSSELRLVSILGRIGRGEHSIDDRDYLLRLGRREAGLDYNFNGVLIHAILKGWPKSTEVKAACLEGVADEYHRERQIDKGVAIPILLRGYQSDSDVARYCIDELRDREYPFLSLNRGGTWKELAIGFRDNAELFEAVDDWLEKEKLNGPEMYLAAVMTRSVRAKRKLLSMVSDSFCYWSVKALLEAWGMDDPEVVHPLTALAIGDNGKAASIGSVLPSIIRDQEKCRGRLIELLRDTSVRRADMVLYGLLEVGMDGFEAEILDLVFNSVLSNDVLSSMDVASIKNAVISNYPADPRVKALAHEELKGRLADISAASPATIAAAYRNDEDIRKMILQLSSPLPASLRMIAVSQLRSCAHDDTMANSLFSMYDLEEDAEIKSQASLAYYERLHASGAGIESALEDLAESIVCYGPDHEARRQAAFCGLVELNRLDLMKGAVETIGEDRLCAITLMDSMAGGPNVPLVRCLLSHWDQIRGAFGDTFATRLSKGGENPGLWGYLWGLADQFDKPREEGIEIVRSFEKKALPLTALQFVARALPKSPLLLRCCLDTLQIGNDAADTSSETAIIAAEILGRDFADSEAALCEILNARRDGRVYEKEILAFCEAWPDHDLLKMKYEQLQSDGGYLSDAVYVRLICSVGSTEDVEKLVYRLCSLYHCPSSWSTVIAKPIVRRVAADGNLAGILWSHLKTSNKPSEKMSLFRLLASSIGLSSDLRTWAGTELQHQIDDAEVGIDIVSGEMRSVVHAILDSASISRSDYL